MNLNINFEVKTIQLIGETSFEELALFIEKMPELKAFKIVPLIQTFTIEKQIPFFQNPYNPNDFPLINPYYISQKPYEVYCNGLSDNQMSDSTSTYFATSAHND